MTLTFTLQNFYTNPNQLASFSAQGPNVDYSIKPDVVAVGENIYTAAQTYNPGGSIYDPSGYAVVDGTSFSGPLVAGSAAILKQARPGLTVDQYRSMLVNTAGPASLVPGTTANVQQAGAGLVNALSAINATAAVAPVSLGFGAGGDFSSVANLTITNVGAAGDQFQLAVVPSNPSGPVPSLAQTSVQLDPGASIAIPVTFVGSGLVPGQYEGFVTVQGTQSSVVSRVPYWYGVPSGSPAHITVLPNSSSSTVPVGATLQVLFRVTDSTGLPVSGLPTASSVSGGGSVLGVVPYCSGQSCPFALNVRTGTSPGTNVFQILAGSITLQVSIVAQ